MAFCTSAGLSPARRACPRTLVASARNSDLAGVSIRLRITTSPSPMTTNCAPGSRPRAFRTSSGITTWPFEESVVVATVTIFVRFYCTSLHFSWAPLADADDINEAVAGRSLKAGHPDGHLFAAPLRGPGGLAGPTIRREEGGSGPRPTSGVLSKFLCAGEIRAPSGPARSVFLHLVRAGALAPREHDERQPEQLDPGPDQIGRRVPPRVSGPAETRLDDNAARRAEEIVGGQDRGSLLGGYQAVEERLADRRRGGEHEGPQSHQRQGRREARRKPDQGQRGRARHRPGEQQRRPLSKDPSGIGYEGASDDLGARDDGRRKAGDRVRPAVSVEFEKVGLHRVEGVDPDTGLERRGEHQPAHRRFAKAVLK